MALKDLLTRNDLALLAKIRRSNEVLESYARDILLDERNRGTRSVFSLTILRRKATAKLFIAFNQQQEKVGAMCCSDEG